MTINRLNELLLADIKESLDDNRLAMADMYGEHIQCKPVSYELQLNITVDGEEKTIIIQSPLNTVE